MKPGYVTFCTDKASGSERRRMRRARWLARACVLLAPLVAACANHTRIQTSYVSERNDCQRVSEQQLPQYIDPNAPVDPRAANAKLVTLFSNCMFERGWTVATPAREGSAAGVLSAGANLGVGVGSAPPPDRIGAVREQSASPAQDAPSPTQQATPVQPEQPAPSGQGAQPTDSVKPPAAMPPTQQSATQPSREAPGTGGTSPNTQPRQRPSLNQDILRRQQQPGGTPGPDNPPSATAPPLQSPPVASPPR